MGKQALVPTGRGVQLDSIFRPPDAPEPAHCYNARMSDDKPPRQFLIGDGFAVSCEFDPTTNAFDFTVNNGSRKVTSFPEATPEQIAKLITDIENCCPLARKGERENT